MNEFKDQLEKFREKISKFKTYSDDGCKIYIGTLKELQSVLVLNAGKIENTKTLKRVNNCLKEIKIELHDRFDPYFFTISDRKKQSEFTYSKMILTDSLKRIIKSL